MRPTYLNFEDLVKQYEQEMWENERQTKYTSRKSGNGDQHKEDASMNKPLSQLQDNVQ